MTRWVIETQFIYGFENCWSDDDGTPTTFATRKQARAELLDHLKELQEAQAAGDMSDVMTRENFRIVKQQ